ncbi:transposase [Meiothermus rufus]|uniref:transposase n=1 Tax=Meiothermus rufus TaxID=604332 RepID=UPI000A04A988
MASTCRFYPSDLSDAEWALLEPLIPAPKPGGRPAKVPGREIVNAILYVLNNGIQGRAMPHGSTSARGRRRGSGSGWPRPWSGVTGSERDGMPPPVPWSWTASR